MLQWATYIAALTSVGCIFKSTAFLSCATEKLVVLNGHKRNEPHLALQSAAFSGHGFCRLGGVVQLSLDPPTGGFGSRQLFFGLLELIFQLTHSVGCLLSLCADARVSAPAIPSAIELETCSHQAHLQSTRSLQNSLAWSLYCSVLRLSSSHCSNSSFSFFSSRLTILEAW